MKKRFISMALTSMLLLSSAISDTQVVLADQANVQTDSVLQVQLEADLEATAGYVMNSVYDRISADDYATMSYNDYVQATLALKAGSDNENVVSILKDYLKEENNVILHGSASATKSMEISTAILFLNEIGVDCENFQNVNLGELLYETYMAETNSNPYAYGYVNAAARQTLDGEKLDALLAKLKTDVLSYYVDGEDGVGIDYWGISVDNNGMVLSALTQMSEADTDIAEKVAGAIDWSLQQCDASGAVVSWGAPNASSTAQGLRLCAEFKNMEAAEQLYEATQQFRSENTEGAYTYGGQDSIFSTIDMLWGMLAYERALDGYWLFESSQVIAELENQQQETTTEEITEEMTQETTTQADDSKEEITTKKESSETTTIDQEKDEQITDTSDAAPVIWLVALMMMSGVVLTFNRKNKYLWKE